jgi:hypothetical protein
MKSYRRLETPKLWGLVKAQTIDSDGNLVDGALTDPATSVEIIITDPVGKVVQVLAAMSKDSTGKYYYTGYTIAADALTGVYDYEIRAVDGTQKSIARGSFEVKEQIQ